MSCMVIDILKNNLDLPTTFEAVHTIQCNIAFLQIYIGKVCGLRYCRETFREAWLMLVKYWEGLE